MVRKTTDVFTRFGLPAILFILTASLVTWPMVISSRAFDNADTLFNTWLISWNIHAVSSLQNPLHPPVFLGQEDAYGRNDLMLTQSITALPLTLFGTQPLRTHNILFVLWLAFAGFAVFLLGLDVGLNRVGGIFAGIAFICLSFFQGHLWHLQLMSTGLGILAIRQGLGYLNGNRKVWIVGLLILLQGMASLYYWYFINFAMMLMVIWALLKKDKRIVLHLFLWIAVGNLLLLPLLINHFANAAAFGMDSVASSDIAAFFFPWDTSFLFGGFRPDFLTGEAAFWPGIAVLAGALLWVIRTRMLQPVKNLSFLMLMAGFFLIFSLGPVLVVWGNALAPAPFRFFGWLPGMSSIRLPSRAAFLFLLPFVLIAGRTLGRRKWVAGLGIALCLLEVVPVKLGMIETEPDPWHPWIAENDVQRVVYLPLSLNMERPEKECKRLFGSILHYTPTVNGYSTSLPDGYAETAAILNTWPSPEADSLLSELQIDCVILRDFAHLDADTVWTRGPRPTSGFGDRGGVYVNTSSVPNSID